MLRQRLSRRPRDASGHRDLAEVLLEQGRTEEAIEHARTALAEAPLEGRIQLAGAAILAESGRPDLALPHYRRGLSATPDDVEGLVGHARACLVLRRTTEAERALTTALRHADDEDEADLRLLRGVARLNAVRLQAAEADLRAGLAREPDDPDLLVHLGQALVMQAAGGGGGGAAVLPPSPRRRARVRPRAGRGD